MNIKAARTVLAHLKRLQKTPQSARFNMRYFGLAIKDAEFVAQEVLEEPVCGTQACLAGETVLALGLGKVKKRGGIYLFESRSSSPDSIEAEATTALGLTDNQRKTLFYFPAWSGNGGGWPEQFQNDYQAAKTPKARLQVAINRLQHFISTDGAE